MKIALILLTLLPGLSFAYNTEYFNVKSNSITKIDVANKSEVISLKVSIKSANAFSVPTAVVTKEDGGFECQVSKTILLFAGYDTVTGLHHQDFEIKVQWGPGSDLSGCMIEVKHPSLTQAKAYLFMNY